jgi:signal recognition particle receptor subunit beta
MQLDFAAREVSLKIVYYGPARSGKTTNLVALHRMAGADTRGRLLSLETEDDRTLFFDLLPLRFRASKGDVSLRLKLFTVPGQPIHAATRKLVLQGVDGVVMVADSRLGETQANASSFLDLRANLRENGLELARVPVVIQFNKRDLPDIRSDDELRELASRGQEPVYAACAKTGMGVLETFLASLAITWRSLDAAHGLGARLGVDDGALLASAAEHLGATEPPAVLLDRRVGGHLGAVR